MKTKTKTRMMKTGRRPCLNIDWEALKKDYLGEGLVSKIKWLFSRNVFGAVLRTWALVPLPRIDCSSPGFWAVGRSSMSITETAPNPLIGKHVAKNRVRDTVKSLIHWDDCTLISLIDSKRIMSDMALKSLKTAVFLRRDALDNIRCCLNDLKRHIHPSTYRSVKTQLTLGNYHDGNHRVVSEQIKEIITTYLNCKANALADRE
jgi:hypothetical protein